MISAKPKVFAATSNLFEVVPRGNLSTNLVEIGRTISDALMIHTLARRRLPSRLADDCQEFLAGMCLLLIHDPYASKTR
jgi:hypothetical protein